MWTLVNNENIDKYFDEYPKLKEFKEIFSLYTNKNKTMLPRFFSQNYPSKYLTFYENKIYNPEKIEFNCSIKLRPLQKRIITTVIKELDINNGQINGIIKASPGSGKTILSIYLTSILKYKALIIVDSKQLMEQWINAILQVTNLVPDDIGKIQESLFPDNNKKIIIATVQTLLSQFKTDPKNLYVRLKELRIGVVFFDECHKSSSSQQYARISTVLPVNNIIGLSATPYKTKEQDVLMKNVLGNLIYDGAEYAYLPNIDIIYYRSNLDKYRGILGKFHEYVTRRAYYNKILCNSETYLNLFPKYIKQDLKEHRKIIVICQTERQIKAISERLDKEGITYKQYYGKSRDFKKSDNVLIGTYAYCGTGFDFKELSSLIYATPLSGRVSLIQTAGRVLRTCEGKQNPKIRYFVDMTFPSLFLPDVKRVKEIFTSEFNGADLKEIHLDEYQI